MQLEWHSHNRPPKLPGMCTCKGNNILHSVLDRHELESTIARPWESNSYRLVSWWDMEKFSAEDVYKVARALQIVTTNRGAFDEKVSTDDLHTQVLKEARDYLEEIGLRLSLLQLNRMIKKIEGGETTNRQLTLQTNELQSRIQDEMSLALFLHISSKKAEYFGKPQLFGIEVAQAFPSVTNHLEEAGNCLALGRNTACVFHLQGVMQVGLKTLGSAIGIPATINRTWDAILDKIDPEMRTTYTSRSQYFKEHEIFVAESAALLRSVKIAWRNPVMHVENIYNDDKATDVFNSVKAFMRHLATELHEQNE